MCNSSIAFPAWPESGPPTRPQRMFFHSDGHLHFISHAAYLDHREPPHPFTTHYGWLGVIPAIVKHDMAPCGGASLDERKILSVIVIPCIWFTTHPRRDCPLSRIVPSSTLNCQNKVWERYSNCLCIIFAVHIITKKIINAGILWKCRITLHTYLLLTW